MRNCIRLLLLVFICSQVVGCATVGPDFLGVPAPPVGGDYVGARGTALEDTSGLFQWWSQFNDPTLVSLLQIAQQRNFTLEEAAFRILESRARLGITGANFLPDGDFTSSYSFTQRANNADPFGAISADPFDLISVGFDAGWEIDLFGRLTRSREVARANLIASEFDRTDIRITLLAEVASIYVQIRNFQQQLEISRSNLVVQEQSIKLVKEREEAGVSTKLDSEQAIAFKLRTEANTNLIKQQLDVAINQLSVLLGSVPSDEIRMLVGHGNIPFAAMTGIGMPANILRLRPDVRRAEAEVAAASAQIGVAVSDLYPQLNILGTISVNSRTASDLFTSGSLGFSVGPSLTWNILHFGRICFNIRAQEALMHQSIAAYREVVIQAVREVEDGLAQHQGEVRRAATLRQAVIHDVNAVLLATDRYKFGKANYQRVLDAEQQSLQDALNESQARANAAIQLISVFKAVGGGQGPVFSHEPPPTYFDAGCAASNFAAPSNFDAGCADAGCVTSGLGAPPIPTAANFAPMDFAPNANHAIALPFAAPIAPSGQHLEQSFDPIYVPGNEAAQRVLPNVSQAREGWPVDQWPIHLWPVDEWPVNMETSQPALSMQDPQDAPFGGASAKPNELLRLSSTMPASAVPVSFAEPAKPVGHHLETTPIQSDGIHQTVNQTSRTQDADGESRWESPSGGANSWWQ